MNHTTLFPLEPVLSAKQQQVLDLLRDNPAGLRSTDIGRHLHMARNAPCACNPDTICKWAFSDGERIGKQLRRLEPAQAIKRKSGLWNALYGVIDGRYDPATAPFPDNF